MPLTLLSSVALLHDLPEQRLARGQVGTVVELYDEEHAEVEFVDNDGRTYALLTLQAEELMQLHHHPLQNAA